MKKLFTAFILMTVTLLVLSGCQKTANVLPVSQTEISAQSAKTQDETTDQTQFDVKVNENPFNIKGYPTKNHYDIKIKQEQKNIVQRLYTATNGYVTGLPGGMIIADKNTDLTFTVENDAVDETSMHWHGLKLPIEQDGAMTVIKKGETIKFAFNLKEAGTFWYHPHLRPLLPQLNSGLYAPFIVKDDFDDEYAGDYVLTLDDWALDNKGKIDDRYSVGGMTVAGKIETVNSKTGDAIDPIKLKQGEIIKLRFINASTAQSHNISLEGHKMLVTHLDGARLVEPYEVESFTIDPGERFDVEVKGIESEGTFYLRNERDFGMRVPVIYDGIGENMQSPYIPIESRGFANILEKPVDQEFVLDMRHMNWSINGEFFPDTKPVEMKTGIVYKLRFVNNDTMMGGSIHPMHIHGEHFQVISINGEPVEKEIFKDTIGVRPLEYVDIAIKFDSPGAWMLHCHIIDHEDNGMLTILNVTE